MRSPLLPDFKSLVLRGNNCAGPYTGWARGYVYLDGQQLAEYGDATTYFIHKDHLGSTRLITDLSGNTHDSLDFLPFGEQIAGGTGSTHKFTGYERDAESNLDNAQARYYSSSMGRFMSPDPYNAGADPYDPQSWNMYSYVRNNPLNLTDPTGMVYEVCMNGYDITYAGGCNELPGDTVGELNDYLSQYPGRLEAEGDPNSFGGSGSIVSLAHSDTGGTYEFEEPDALGTTITVSGNPPYTFWSPLVEINPGQPGTPSGQGDPGGSGGMSPSPQTQANNKPGFWSCTFSAGTGTALGTTALDAIGIIPGGGNVLHGVQLAAGVGALGLSLGRASFSEATVGGATTGLAFADAAGETTWGCPLE